MVWICRGLLRVDIRSKYFQRLPGVRQRLSTSAILLDPATAPLQPSFTEAQARAFMLLHIFMHELGHHYDRIHQKHLGSSKGEDYAERFATSRFEQLFPAYVRVFGHPGNQG